MTKEVIEQLPLYFSHEQYDVIYNATSADFQQHVPFSQFDELCRDFNKGTKGFERLLERHIFGVTESVWLDTKKRKAIYALYDAQYVIMSFYIRPIETYKGDKRWTRNKYRLPICDEWFVFWGGTNVFDNYHYDYDNQRYAYDFVRVQNGKTHSGDGSTNEQYYAFNTAVVAPLAGKVVRAVDGIADNTIGETNEYSPLGNHVILKHKHGEYSVVAHLKQHSVNVREGDRVEEGQIVGACGNSGNSSEPHIHFHVMDDAAWEKATSIRIKLQQKEPLRGHHVTPAPFKEKMSVLEKVDNAITLYDIVMFIPRIIASIFKSS